MTAEVVAKPVKHLTAGECEAVCRLIEDSYELNIPSEDLLRHYCSAISDIFLLVEAGQPVAFQFYQVFNLDGVEIFQFSLAGKKANFTKTGVQRAFGRDLMIRRVRRPLNPFRHFAVVGISNNPKTYKNMLLTGGEVFPDVTQPNRPFNYKALYEKVAQRLQIQGLNISTGVINDRCASLGLRLKLSAFDQRDDPLHKCFMEYIHGDVNNGVLTMSVSTPAVTALSLLGRRLKLR